MHSRQSSVSIDRWQCSDFADPAACRAAGNLRCLRRRRGALQSFANRQIS
jgi:hypothetical protein